MPLEAHFTEELRDSLRLRRIVEGEAMLDRAEGELAKLQPADPDAASLLLLMAQWVDVGYRRRCFGRGRERNSATRDRRGAGAEEPVGRIGKACFHPGSEEAEEMKNEQFDHLISFLEVCAFPPIRERKANGWGTGRIPIHAAGDRVDRSN